MPEHSRIAPAQRRWVWLIPLLVVATLVVVAVAVYAVRQRPQTDGTAAGPSPTPTSTVAALVPVPDVLSSADVPGLKVDQQSTVDPNDQRAVSTVALPGDDAVATAVTSVVDKEVATYEGRLSADVQGSELNVTTDAVLAAGDVLGIRVQTFMYTGGAHGATTTQTVYLTVPDGAAATPDQLVADPGTLAGWVGDALRDGGQALSDPLPEDVTRDVRFDDDGAIVVVLDQGVVAAEAAGVLAVRIEPGSATSILSDAGTAVRDAAVAAETFVGAPQPVATQQPGTGQPAGGSVDCDQLKCIALTFDDGPGPYTATLLDELAAKNVHTTFFLVGKSVTAYPDLVARELADGHVIGNHTWDHRDLRKLSADEINAELDQTAAAIQDATGATTTLVRPPYGATNDTVTQVLTQRGASSILWNVDTEDWKNLDVAITTQRALAGAAPGAIILMHDIHPTTVQAAPGIIDALQAQGYTLVTIPQLLGDSLPPGSKHFSQHQ